VALEKHKIIKKETIPMHCRYQQYIGASKSFAHNSKSKLPLVTKWLESDIKLSKKKPSQGAAGIGTT
jgi:hypothetical protein